MSNPSEQNISVTEKTLFVNGSKKPSQSKNSTSDSEYISSNGDAKSNDLANVTTPADLARRREFKSETVNGTIEYHGANPSGAGATEDGFILNSDGTAYDRKLSRHYTSPEVAALFGITRDEYEPCRQFRERNGHSSVHLNGHANGHTPPVRATVPQLQKPRKTLDTRTLAERSITPETMQAFGIVQRKSQRAGDFIEYPTHHPDGKRGRDRLKYQQPDRAGTPEKPQKNIWTKTGGEGVPVGYGLERVQRGDNVVLTNGEVSVWSCFQEGITAVCSFGEARNPEPLLRALQERGVVSVRIVLDNDITGRTATENALRAACAIGLSATAHAWPQSSKESADVSDLYEECQKDGRELLSALEALPIWTPEAEAPDESSTRFASSEATTPEPRKRFKILAAAQMMEKESPEEIIEEMIYRNTTVCLSGAFASFKSFVVKSWAYSIAGGHQWQGKAVLKCAVLIITAEGVSGNKQRIRALEIRHGHKMEASYLPQAVQIHRPDDVEALLSEIREMPELPGVIVIDTLARCFVGGDENSARDAGLFNAGVDRLRTATGATIIVLHHIGKSGDIRGSTAFTGAFDTLIEAKRRDDIVTLKCHKQKDAEEFKDVTLVKRVVELDIKDKKGNSLTSLVFDSTDTPAAEMPRADQTRDAIYNTLLEAQRPLKSGEWQRACLDKLAVRESSFHAHRQALVDSSAVEKSGSLYSPKNSKNSKNSKIDKLDGLNYSTFSNNSIELEEMEKTESSSLPGMPTATPREKKNPQADSEAYLT